MCKYYGHYQVWVSQILKKKKILTRNKTESMLSPELLGLNVEIGQEYVYKANSNQERKLLEAEMPLSTGRDMQLDNVLVLPY